MRGGFKLYSAEPHISVSFDAEGDLWIEQGGDKILIRGKAIDVFKSAMQFNTGTRE